MVLGSLRSMVVLSGARSGEAERKIKKPPAQIRGLFSCRSLHFTLSSCWQLVWFQFPQPVRNKVLIGYTSNVPDDRNAPLLAAGEIKHWSVTLSIKPFISFRNIFPLLWLNKDFSSFTFLPLKCLDLKVTTYTKEVYNEKRLALGETTIERRAWRKCCKI